MGRVGRLLNSHVREGVVKVSVRKERRLCVHMQQEAIEVLGAGRDVPEVAVEKNSPWAVESGSQLRSPGRGRWRPAPGGS